MNIEVLFFGQLTDITKCSTMSIDNPGSIYKLKSKLINRYPALEHMKFIIALNNKITLEDELIEVNSKIAIMPPFSGG